MMLPNFTRTLTSLAIVVALMAGAFFGGIMLTRKEAVRWQQNFDAERDSLIREIRNDQTLYMAQTVSLTRKEFKQYFETEWKQLTKDYGLRDPQQLTNLETVTTYNIKTTLRDSVVRDTVKVKVMDYRTKNISIQATIEADTMNLTYRHYLGLDIVLSKQRRAGFANKVLLRPWTRPIQVTAIPDDKNTVITKLKTTIVK